MALTWQVNLDKVGPVDAISTEKTGKLMGHLVLDSRNYTLR
ncbi:hypothetical protein COLO4_37922 [Corchorus olitorius]|uniref:Uncharacterized protein n=1 Tax=Corchorus olitorius TaxID=93759 RepID=A0A1R3FXY5_9ROSI|nr:hypothetical protein COLO4_37922 [Corchorus olitorius]